MFKAPPAPQAPSAPDPPPNPPMFGKDAYGTGPRKRTASQGFAGTILGGLGEAATAQKTLLGL